MQAKPANHSAFWALLPISCICSCLANHENHPISHLSSICLSLGSKFVGWVWRLVGALKWLLKSIDHPPCYFPWWVWIPSPSPWRGSLRSSSTSASARRSRSARPSGKRGSSPSPSPECLIKLSCWNIYFWKQLKTYRLSMLHHFILQFCSSFVTFLFASQQAVPR